MNIKNSLLIFLSTALLFVVGCQSKEEKAIEKTNERVQELTNQAEKYYSEGDILKSLTKYKEISELKNSPDIEEVINNIDNEIKNAKLTKKFLNELYTIEKDKLRSGISVSSSDMEYIMKDLKILIDGFESIDISQDNEINAFINEIKNDDSFYNYKSLKDEANNDVYRDGGTTDLLSDLDSSFGVFASSFMAFNRENVLKDIESILKNEFPKKYNVVLED
ncbi:hypothetical protein ACIQD3_11760 [Peribacillus loiseleuriae]|uniref:hypothetical protein n=1 Tax=Peribacillus loiseleuriae TaxID=1679170 RepID=UPI0038216EAA